MTKTQCQACLVNLGDLEKQKESCRAGVTLSRPPLWKLICCHTVANPHSQWVYRCILHSFRILGLYSVSGLKCCSLLGASLISCKPGWCHYEVMGRWNLAGLAQVLKINNKTGCWEYVTTTILLFYRWKYYMTQKCHQLSNTFSVTFSWWKTKVELLHSRVSQWHRHISSSLCSFVCVCRVGWGCCVSLQHLPPLCAFSRVSQADNLNGSWGGQQIPFRMAARVSREFHSALKAIWEIKVESRRFERTSCGRRCRRSLLPAVSLRLMCFWLWRLSDELAFQL